MARVVIVEDDGWMADCFRLWLARDEHVVRHAQDIQEAIDMIDEEVPDLIILDLFLPLANGVQLLHTLRSHADLAPVPVILASAALPEQLPDMSAYGVRQVIDKAALTPAKLREAVRACLMSAHAAI